MRVGLLGCGNVGAAVIRLLHEHARGDRAAGRMPRWRSCAWPCATPDRARRAAVSPRRSPTDAGEVVEAADVDIVCELIGGVDPARELILRAFGAGKPVVTANKELLANHGRELFDAADDARARPLLRGRRRRRHPADPAAEGVAGRRADRADARHRERHDELHPHADVRPRLVVRRRARRGAAAGLRRGGSHRRRRGARRRREVRDPRVDRVQRPGRRRRRLPRGDLRRHAAGHRRRRRDGLRGEAARDRGAAGRRHHRPGPSRDGPGRASAGERSRRVQRGLHRGRAGRAADVLRPRRGRRPHGGLGGRRPRHRGPQPDLGRPRRGLHLPPRPPDPPDGRHAPASTT